MTDLESRLRRAASSLEAPPADIEGLVDRAGREGLLDVAYTTEDSPVGELLVAVTPRGLVRISYLDLANRDQVLAQLSERISPRVLAARRPLDDVLRQLDSYMAGRLTEFDLTLDWALVGPFGRSVLERTAAIPFGEVATYGEVARAIGSPKASRATGNALARNPIPIVVPCHRVVPGSGGIGNYAGGTARKEFLLSLEGRKN